MGFSGKTPRISYIKRKRQCGFRSRMKTKSGRKMINRRRAMGRKLPNV
jgi:large subunit ribosomal protein L34